ncbi:sugar transferase [uncultured Clostridium sp.]|uniref:sugar transferase n=1 Tax=uncultured Clostridium sp. TaxID=59620 RepID=UPI00321688FA
MKRAFDLVVSVIALIVLSPIILIISILVKLDNNGPVIFKQYRVGKNNKKFVIYKFRSMVEYAPEVASTALENPDEYITTIGKLLRKTSLDELPQLLNIIKGDMSLVGPRPVINDESEKELLKLRTEYGVHKLVPGLTGWAQINGRDSMSTARKITLEKEYLKRRSFIFDFKILFMTFVKVFRQEGIVEGREELEEVVYHSVKAKDAM